MTEFNTDISATKMISSGKVSGRLSKKVSAVYPASGRQVGTLLGTATTDDDVLCG